MGDFNVKHIDDVIHGRLRLGIISYLATAGAADFNELKALLETTAGNLSVHLRKLEDAGYVKVTKSFLLRKSLTRAAITRQGHKAFLAYLAEVRSLVDSHPSDTSRSVAAFSTAAARKRSA